MKKSIALACFILAFPAICFGQNSEDKFNWAVEVRWINFTFQNSRMEVRDIPESLRQIPVHERDRYPGLTGKTLTVKSDVIKPGMFVFFSPTIAPEVTFGRLTVRGGSVMNIPIKPQAVKGGVGSTRILAGEGDIPVFYAVEIRRSAKLGWLGELEYRSTRNLSFLAGHSSFGYDMLVVNGWKKVNGFQIYSENTISSNHLNREYIGTRIKSRDGALNFLIIGGVNLESSDPTPLAGNLKMSHGVSYFANVSFSMTIGADQ